MYKKYLKQLKENPLFKNLSENEIKYIFSVIHANIKTVKKDEYILVENQTNRYIYIILDGDVKISRTDYWGNLFIIAHLKPVDLFAETFACIKNSPVSVNAIASSNCTLILIDINQLMDAELEQIHLKEILLKNLISVFALKNRYLSQKIEILSQRSIREKLMSYLTQISRQKSSNDFTIDFNRKQLSEYLSVDRSALSSEISKLNKECIIISRKNHFILNKQQ